VLGILLRGETTVNRPSRSARYAGTMRESAEELRNKTKKKNPRFAKEVLEQASLVREHQEPSQQCQRGIQELRHLINKLDQSHKDTSKSGKASEALQPFINGITAYIKVVDQLVESDLTVSALVWGGAQFCLQVRSVVLPLHLDSWTNTFCSLPTTMHSTTRRSRRFWKSWGFPWAPWGSSEY
jgi:nitrate/nitrite-specific signal transduction histidine kinase